MIKIIFIDPILNIQPVEKVDIRVDDPSQYLVGYDRIVKSIHLDEDLVVLVTDRVVFNWLLQLKQKYKGIQAEERDLHEQLKRQIGISIPENITDQQITASGLLDLHIPGDPASSFEDYLLRIFIGDFILSTSSFHNIVSFITNYNPQRWQTIMSRPVVKEFYENRVKGLTEEYKKAGRKAEVQILEWLKDSPDVLHKNLYTLRIVSDYPADLGKRLLGRYFRELRELSFDLTKLPEYLGGSKELINEIAVYLDQNIKNLGDLRASDLLEQVSGFLGIEFESIHQLLLDGKTGIDEDLVRKIQRKFKPLRNVPRYAQALDDLDLLISRQKPTRPSPDWLPEEWIKWSVEEYLPYRFWLEDVGRLDDEIAEIAGEYADWYFKNYGQMLYHSDHMAWKALHNLKDTLKAHDDVTLVVLVDNLNLKFYPDLRNQLQHCGFYEHQLEYCFSNLPSCTEVSKKSILTGHYSPFSDTSYSRQVTEAWKAKLGKKVKYLSGIGALRAEVKRDADVYILNYLPLDIALHQSEFDTGLSHAQAIRGYVSALAQDIKSFAKQMSAERNLLLVVASDHGSTKIPKEGINVIKGEFYKRKAIDEHHRYIEIDDEEAEKLREVKSYEYYLFDRSLFELPSNYLVARRLYHFRPVDENVYVHGGLTPEETLIPMAIYKPVSIMASPLDISLVGNNKLYIGTKIDLELEVTNVNNYPCDNVVLEIAEQYIDARLFQIDVLKQLERTKVKLTARCLRTADRSATKLSLKITFDFLGKPFEHLVTVPVEIIDPAQTKFDLRKL